MASQVKGKERVLEQAGSPSSTTALDLTSNQQIEAEEFDTDDSETDSAIGDDLQSFTTSVTSSITNYKYENGRRYHAYKDGSYFMPNDETENDRLDLSHHICTMRMGGELHLAPIPKDESIRILDLGTGTGIWAIEMADTYPEAQILGNDLSPIQPSMVPPNVHFEVDDIENQWIYSSKFDYIHCRYLTGSIKDWPKLMQQAFKFTKPGGWVEFQDFTMTFYTSQGELSESSALSQWAKGIREGVAKIGMEPESGPKLEGWVKEAGFSNVTPHIFPIPVGMWAKDPKMKEIGAFALVNITQALEGGAARIFTSVHGWSFEEVQILLAKCREELKKRRLMAQYDLHTVYAQKPLDAE